MGNGRDKGGGSRAKGVGPRPDSEGYVRLSGQHLNPIAVPSSRNRAKKRDVADRVLPLERYNGVESGRREQKSRGPEESAVDHRPTGKNEEGR